MQSTMHLCFNRSDEQKPTRFQHSLLETVELNSLAVHQKVVRRDHHKNGPDAKYGSLTMEEQVSIQH